MKAKHTPGPWQRMNSHKAGFQNVVSLGDDQPQNRKFVCEISPSDTTHSDADLISAAPELLEACEQLLAIVDRLNHDTYDQSKIPAGCSSEWKEQVTARAVIAKAKGESK